MLEKITKYEIMSLIVIQLLMGNIITFMIFTSWLLLLFIFQLIAKCQIINRKNIINHIICIFNK